jgi:hypothetical protein
MYTKLDAAISDKNMPKGKTWMSISPDVVNQLTEPELKALVRELVCNKGQKEHSVFYTVLEKYVLGTDKTINLIENAKGSKNAKSSTAPTQ